MNSNISAEMLSVSVNTSLLESFVFLVIYIAIAIWLFKFVQQNVKQQRHFSLENVWGVKKILSSYKNNATSTDASNINITPLQAGFLLEEKITRNHIIATILHFLDLGIIKLEKIYRNDHTFAYRFEKNEMEFCNYNLYTSENITTEKKEKVIKRGISISEICLIDRIVFKYYNHINADRIFTLYDSIDDFSKLYNLKNGINELKDLDFDLEKVKKCIKSEFIDLGLYSYKEKQDKTLRIIESKLYEEKEKILFNYIDKIQNDTLLSERCIENIYLSGEHLIYGVAFGVCKASINDAIDIYKDRRKK